MKLSAHFALGEFTRSESAKREGLDNTPTAEHLENLKTLCEKVLEPIRLKYGSINISSGYRGKMLNHFIGGSGRSAAIAKQVISFESLIARRLYLN